MKRAIALARRALGRTVPNPVVGSLVVRDGEICGRGWHQRAGGDHAEVFALREAGEHAFGADLYVSLEPCNHQGKTPPCTEAIVEAGIKRVFIAMTDPNPLVSGAGVRRLRAAGAEVIEGICKSNAEELLLSWTAWLKTGVPRYCASLCLSLDGYLAQNLEGADDVAHARFRRECLRYDANLLILSAETNIEQFPIAGLIYDDDLCALAKLLPERVANQGETQAIEVFTAETSSEESRAELVRRGLAVHICQGPSLHERLKDMHRLLGERGYQSILLRDAKTIGHMTEAGLLSELSVVRFPRFLGEVSEKPFSLERPWCPDAALRLVSSQRLGSCEMTRYLVDGKA